MNEFDDFPLSAACWADSKAFYDAFLKAKKLIAAANVQGKETKYSDRTIHELTSQIYASSGTTNSFFRASSGMVEPKVAVWLSKVRVLAEWFCAANPIPVFAGLDKSYLGMLSKKSINPEAIIEVAADLLKVGIIVVYEPAIPGAKLDGAVFKISSGNPVIGISLRYARVDYFWFTLMHELAHIVMHAELLSTPIIDDLEEESIELIEQQANKLALDSVIPRNEWRTCPAKYSLEEKDIHSFAKSLGISPVIVAGRLRKELNRYDLFSDLVHKVDVREILLEQI